MEPVLTQSTSSPWKRLPVVEPCSLSSVMDEELARDLQKKEDGDFPTFAVSHQPIAPSVEAFPAGEGADTSNDFILAQMLQHELDKEHDAELQVREKHFNAGKKVTLSFDNFRRLPAEELDDVDGGEEEDDGDSDEDAWPALSQIRGSGGGGKDGKRRSRGNGKTPTKHDLDVCGRKNARTIEDQFPPGFSSGPISSGRDMDVRLPNHVFNLLKEHSLRDQRHRQRLNDKRDHSTQAIALDPKTQLLLFKMVSNGTLSEVGGCVSTGKEACVFHAIAGAGLEDDDENAEKVEEQGAAPAEYAIKVYKTTLTEFKTRDRYIRDDVRFSDRFSSQNPRKVIHLWAEKEMRNLLRLHRAGLPCPEVVLLSKHILVMTFIGQDGCPAPQLKDAKLSARQMQAAYTQCLDIIRRMYTECHLIHSDLSEYNLLWYDDVVHVIDVGQAVEPWHPHAFDFLQRDCTNIMNFFQRSGLVPDVLTVRQMLSHVTGCDVDAQLEEDEFLAQIHALMTKDGRKGMVTSSDSEREDTFDELFAKAQKARTIALRNSDDSDQKEDEEEEQGHSSQAC